MAEEETVAPKKAPAKKAAAPKAAAEKAASAAEKKAAEKKAPAKKAAAPKADAAEKAPAAKAAPKAAAAKAADTKAPAKAKAAPKAETAAKADAPSEVVAAPAEKGPRAAKSVSTKPATEADVRPQVLKVHHLRPAVGAKKDKTRVGRGEGSKGKTAGRGTKGTKARYSVRPGFEAGNIGFVMRSPKLRGFKNPFRVEYQVVNLEKLADLYPKGGDVTIADLVAKGAVRKNEKVKVLGDGDIAVKLNVAVDKVSGSAEQKIVAAGGSVK
jgi:large subunit ribosomal protein L15